MRHKIVLTKNDEVNAAAEKLGKSEAQEIAFVIPRQSAFGNSVSNFRLLKREAEAQGKQVSVESVDESVLALAHAAGLEAIHPILTRAGRVTAMADIIPATTSPPGTPVPGGKRGGAKKAPRVAPAQKEKEEPRLVFSAPESSREMPPEEPVKPRARRHISFGRWKKPIGAIVLLLAVLLGGGWTFAALFGTARAVIHFKKSPLSYEGTVVAAKSVALADLNKGIIPAEVFSDQRNMTQLFPASGRSVVATKATGKITISNAYRGEPQTLVATTRFMAPDGKVFRIDERVTVPGANVVRGKITPASVEAVVVADKAGPDYNVGPIPRLTIPGFKGTPKYAGFYGAINAPLAGGALGEHAVPTDGDMKNAKEKVTGLLRSSLTNNLISRRPQGIIVPDGASETTVTKLTAGKAADDKGNFGVFGEASFRAIGFRESDMRALVLAHAAGAPDLMIKDLALSYTGLHADFEKGQLGFSVAAQGTLTQSFSPDEFKKKLYGKSAEEARAEILALPGIVDATLSFWPKWLLHIPSDPRRLQMVIE